MSYDQGLDRVIGVMVGHLVSLVGNSTAKLWEETGPIARDSQTNLPVVDLDLDLVVANLIPWVEAPVDLDHGLTDGLLSFLITLVLLHPAGELEGDVGSDPSPVVGVGDCKLDQLSLRLTL